MILNINFCFWYSCQSFLFQGKFDFEHVFCKLDIHLSNFYCINGEHHFLSDFYTSSHTKVNSVISGTKLTTLFTES